MNESSKVTIYYNKLFKQNHAKLLERINKLCEQNKVELISMEDKFKTREDVLEFFHRVNDLEEVIQRNKWETIADEKLSVLIYLIKNNPSSLMLSCVATWPVGKRNFNAINKKEIENILDRIEGGSG